MNVLRTYADTSVFGGCCDVEFRAPSIAFFELVRSGSARLIMTTLTTAELASAPAEVRAVLNTLPTSATEDHDISPEMEMLQKAYLKAGVVGSASEADALHVAAATVLACDVIVSWNFKHIVNLRRIRGFNAVNMFNGYRSIEIRSPMEVTES